MNEKVELFGKSNSFQKSKLYNFSSIRQRNDNNTNIEFQITNRLSNYGESIITLISSSLSPFAMYLLHIFKFQFLQ